jgi:K+-sensing histidine kinase KdpD
VAAAVKITSPDQDAVIATAALYAQLRGEPCFVISIIDSLRHLNMEETEREIVERNLALIAARNASPVMQEGDDVARGLRQAAEQIGAGTLFIRNGRRRIGRTLAERVIHQKPPFQVIVLSPQT